MSQLPKPVFLEYSSYRLRRRIDAVKLLPFLGLGLFLLPALTAQIGDGTSTSQRLILFFASWVVLIVLARVIARGLPGSSQIDDVSGEG